MEEEPLRVMSLASLEAILDVVFGKGGALYKMGSLLVIILRLSKISPDDVGCGFEAERLNGGCSAGLIT